MFFAKSNIEYLIVGLGNPDSKYADTRHNVGFMAIDKLGEKLGCRFEKMKFDAIFGKCTVAGKRCLLVKPQTYMNNSGRAVRDMAAFYKVPLERIIVVADDISLPVGKLRIRRSGSAGGHNGLKDIIALCGGEGFARVKIGVGDKPNPNYDLADWVLSKFTADERAPLNDALTNACDALELMVAGNVDRAMNRFN